MDDIVRDVSPESLARANEVSLMEGIAACWRAYGGEVVEQSDLLWCALNIPGAGWNRVTRALFTPATLDERIEWVIGQVRAKRISCLWNVGPSMRPLDLGAHLVRHGLVDVGDEPAMGIALAGLPDTLPLPASVVVERVMDQATMARWISVLGAGFEVPDSISASLRVMFARDSFDERAAAHYYLASLGGEPVAVSALTLTGGVAGIFCVATIESARGRGIGAAVTLAPLLDARARGYAVGVLQSSEMGYSVYARLGFTEQFRYRNYVWRPE